MTKYLFQTLVWLICIHNNPVAATDSYPFDLTVKLKGVLEQEQRFGAPNYGESPDMDERLKVYVLGLKVPVVVGTQDTLSELNDAVVTDVDKVQVVFLNGWPRTNLLGNVVELRGVLSKAIWGREFYPVVLRVYDKPPVKYEEAVDVSEPAEEVRPRQANRARRAEVQVPELLRQVEESMVVIPGGTFRMGDLGGDGNDDARPVHSVTVPVFEMGKYEVTFDQWDACMADGGCGDYFPSDWGRGRGNRPVIDVSWDDVQLFIAWLNDKTGGNYRLPTEAEWEYVARAGSTTKYSWGDTIGSNRANCVGCGSPWDDKQAAPVGSFAPSNFGLHDMHGNAWEWVEDCWHDNYAGAPTDGSAWVSGGNCRARVVRGGSWYFTPRFLRAAYRLGLSTDARKYFSLGFRLARAYSGEREH